MRIYGAPLAVGAIVADAGERHCRTAMMSLAASASASAPASALATPRVVGVRARGRRARGAPRVAVRGGGSPFGSEPLPTSSSASPSSSSLFDDASSDWFEGASQGLRRLLESGFGDEGDEKDRKDAAWQLYSGEMRDVGGRASDAAVELQVLGDGLADGDGLKAFAAMEALGRYAPPAGDRMRPVQALCVARRLQRAGRALKAGLSGRSREVGALLEEAGQRLEHVCGATDVDLELEAVEPGPVTMTRVLVWGRRVWADVTPERCYQGAATAFPFSGAMLWLALQYQKYSDATPVTGYDPRGVALNSFLRFALLFSGYFSAITGLTVGVGLLLLARDLKEEAAAAKSAGVKAGGKNEA